MRRRGHEFQHGAKGRAQAARFVGLQGARRPLRGESIFLEFRALRPAARGRRCDRVNHCTMPSVRVKENEPFDVALRRFKRACEKAGILTEVRRREYYEKPTTVRKRKKAAAVKRHLKKIARETQKRVRLH